MTCTTEADAHQYLLGLRAHNTSMLPEIYFFWKGPLSQWAPASFKAGANWFQTAEHWMMWNKAQLFGDHEAASRIIDSHTPKDAKEWGRAVRGFNERIWMLHRYDVVRTGNLLKFSQNNDAMKALSLTGDAVLAEANPHDAIWGIGRSKEDPHARTPAFWNGANLLGFALMSVRAALWLVP